MKRSRAPRILSMFALALSLAPMTLSRVAHAEDAPEVEKVETEEAKSPIARETWASEVQTKYSLTDAQMKSLSDAGIQGPHLAFAAELAKQSGKSIDEVIALRTTDKMGWGAIAKKLGVPPGSLGHSVAALRHELKENKGQEKKEEKNAAREERKKLHDERKEERKADRDARKAERQEAKAERQDARAERKTH